MVEIQPTDSPPERLLSSSPEIQYLAPLLGLGELCHGGVYHPSAPPPGSLRTRPAKWLALRPHTMSQPPCDGFHVHLFAGIFCVMSILARFLQAAKSTCDMPDSEPLRSLAWRAQRHPFQTCELPRKPLLLSVWAETPFKSL